MKRGPAAGASAGSGRGSGSGSGSPSGSGAAHAEGLDREGLGRVAADLLGPGGVVPAERHEGLALPLDVPEHARGRVHLDEVRADPPRRDPRVAAELVEQAVIGEREAPRGRGHRPSRSAGGAGVRVVDGFGHGVPRSSLLVVPVSGPTWWIRERRYRRLPLEPLSGS
ncbi:hypothetical protein DEI86_06805 [Curtobacterium sp. MCBD17_028]|nr:hypothetical protein DEI86_06805 [Curtobacterium sp. MCBD17_028]